MACAASASLAMADPWPAWRGPKADGRSEERGLPLSWGPGKNVRWKTALPEPGNSTPIVWGNRVFITQGLENGRLRAVIAFDRQTGKKLWQRELIWKERLPGRLWGSMLLANGRLYVSSLEGKTFVVAGQPKFRLLAINDMGETIYAAPAVSDGTIFLRTHQHLYCIADQATSGTHR
jgi:outer membrane protein assembly factor BamB